MSDLIRLFYRNRRRLSVSLLLVLAASALLSGGWQHAGTMGVAGGLSVFLVLASPLLTRHAPAWRHLTEIAATAYLLFALQSYALADTSGALAGFARDPIVAVALFALTYLGATRQWLDPLLPRPGALFVGRATTRLPLRRIWFGLVPTPGHREDYPDPLVVSIDYADKARQTLRLIRWHPQGPRRDRLVQIHALAPMQHAALEFAHPARRSLTTYHFKDHGDLRRVVTSRRFAALPLRVLLRFWIDDAVGRALDAKLHRMAATAPPKPTAPTAPATPDRALLPFVRGARASRWLER